MQNQINLDGAARAQGILVHNNQNLKYFLGKLYLGIWISNSNCIESASESYD